MISRKVESQHHISEAMVISFSKRMIWFWCANQKSYPKSCAAITDILDNHIPETHHILNVQRTYVLYAEKTTANDPMVQFFKQAKQSSAKSTVVFLSNLPSSDIFSNLFIDDKELDSFMKRATNRDLGNELTDEQIHNFAKNVLSSLFLVKNVQTKYLKVFS